MKFLNSQNAVKPQRIVVICGLIRKHRNFLKSLEVYSNLQKRGYIDRIIISTWDNQLRVPLLLKAERNYNIEIQHCPDLSADYNTYGNVFHQSKSLELGLENLNDRDLVLRTRVEYFLNEEFLKNLFDREYMLEKPREAGNIFDKKIWITWAEISKPFFIEDSVFYGQVCDLRKLVTYEQIIPDEVWSKNIGQGRTHVRRFITPFLENPVLQDYIHTENKIPWRKKRRFKPLIKKLHRDSRYCNILAHYYKTLHNYFCLYTESNMASFKKPFCNPISMNENSLIQNIHIDYTYRNTFIFFYNDKWITNIINGLIDEDICHKISEICKSFVI